MHRPCWSDVPIVPCLFVLFNIMDIMRHAHNIKHLQHTSHGAMLVLCCVSMSRHGVPCHAVVAGAGGAGELAGRGLSESGVAGGARAAVGPPWGEAGVVWGGPPGPPPSPTTILDTLSSGNHRLRFFGTPEPNGTPLHQGPPQGPPHQEPCEKPTHGSAAQTQGPGGDGAISWVPTFAKCVPHSSPHSPPAGGYALRPINTQCAEAPTC